MSENSVVHIPIRVECEPGGRGDGAWWKIIDALDERDGLPLGDSGVYEFDADRGFPDKLQETLLTTLLKIGEFDDADSIYVVEITLFDHETDLGHSIARFTKEDTLTWPV